MAGGGGTRLWPLSRKDSPKQFHRLLGDQSLLQMTFDRFLNMTNVARDDIYISTNRKFASEVHDQVDLPGDHLIFEPAKRDNSAALGLSLVSILHQTKDPSQVVGMFASDHIILNPSLFEKVVYFSEKVATNTKQIVVLGVRPTYPETGLGYIEMGPERVLDDPALGLEAVKVLQFKEKPDAATAREFVESFRFLWNLCMFVCRIDVMLDLYKKHMPELYAGLMEISAALGTERAEEVIERVYPALQAISIDYGIMEKTKDVVVIPIDKLGWSDVGNFLSLWDSLPKDSEGNVVQGENVMLHNTKDSIIYTGKRQVISLGVTDMVIVDNGDVLLVASKKESQRMKEVIAKLEQQNLQHLL